MPTIAKVGVAPAGVDAAKPKPAPGDSGTAKAADKPAIRGAGDGAKEVGRSPIDRGRAGASAKGQAQEGRGELARRKPGADDDAGKIIDRGLGRDADKGGTDKPIGRPGGGAEHKPLPLPDVKPRPVPDCGFDNIDRGQSHPKAPSKPAGRTPLPHVSPPGHPEIELPVYRPGLDGPFRPMPLPHIPSREPSLVPLIHA